MSGRGRPVRFLATVALGWVAMRVAILWPETGSLPAAIRAVAVGSAAAAPAFAPTASPARIVRARLMSLPAVAAGPPPAPPVRAIDADRVQAALLAMLQYGDPECVDGVPLFFGSPAPAPAAVQEHLQPMATRWSGGAWFVARPGNGLGAAPGGQLGGGQMGARIAYLLDSRRRIALFARFASPLAGPGREAAAGIEWQPTRLPVRLVAEQRLALDGGARGTGLGVVAGTESAIAPGFRLESYGQAGIVARGRIEPYADGAARAYRVVRERGRVRASLGIGAWGAAQRDAARLDLGPSATLALPMGARQMRLALDWRQRIAGDARPGSGVALTIGSDF